MFTMHISSFGIITIVARRCIFFVIRFYMHLKKRHASAQECIRRLDRLKVTQPHSSPLITGNDVLQHAPEVPHDVSSHLVHVLEQITFQDGDSARRCNMQFVSYISESVDTVSKLLFQFHTAKTKHVKSVLDTVHFSMLSHKHLLSQPHFMRVVTLECILLLKSIPAQATLISLIQEFIETYDISQYTYTFDFHEAAAFTYHPREYAHVFHQLQAELDYY